jgi:hypothetical protein
LSIFDELLRNIAAVGTYGTYGTDLEQLVTKKSQCELGAQRGKFLFLPYISTNFYKRYGRYRRCRQGLCRRGFLVDTSSVKVLEVSAA